MVVGVRIEDNPPALSEMMADLAAYDGPLGPGPYWLSYQAATVKWLKRKGLNTFRSYDEFGKGLAYFGGASLWRSDSQISRERQKLRSRVWPRVASKLGFEILARPTRRRLRALGSESMTRVALASLFYEASRLHDKGGELETIEASIVGQPTDVISVGSRKYTPKFLSKFGHYLFLKQFVDFSRASAYVELGPGVGALVEVLLKVAPQLRAYLIEIPPQLYAAQQILNAIFPGQVATYQDIKKDPGILNSEKHRIFALAPWQIENLYNLHPALFINEATEEIPGSTVSAYLSEALKIDPDVFSFSTVFDKDDLDIFQVADYENALQGYEISYNDTAQSFIPPIYGEKAIPDDVESIGNKAYDVVLSKRDISLRTEHTASA